MKQTRFIFSVLAVLFTGMIFSCSDIAETDRPAVTQGKKIYVSFSIADKNNKTSARETVMPSNITDDDIIQITLSAKKLSADNKYENYTFADGSEQLEWTPQIIEKITQSALSSMQDTPVELTAGTYTFTLNLYTAGSQSQEPRLTQTGILDDIKVSETTEIQFETEYVKYGDLLLTFITSGEKQNFGNIEAGLFSIEDITKPFSVNGTSYDFESLKIEESGDSFSASYVKQDIPNGTYYLKYRVYDSNKKTVLNTWCDVVKIHGYKTQKSIEIDTDEINSLPQNTGSVLIDDARISISFGETPLYLNTGSIHINACYENRLNEGNEPDAIDTDCITAKLMYGGAELSDDFYHWEKDGFLAIGGESKLISGGTYQVYVTVYSTQDHEQLIGSAVFDVEIIDKEYYEYDVSEQDSGDEPHIEDPTGDDRPVYWQEQLYMDMWNLSAPAIIKVTGTGENTVIADESAGIERKDGTLRQISAAQQESNKFYPVELDLSEVEGITVINNHDISSVAFSSIILPDTITTIKKDAFNFESEGSDGWTFTSRLTSINIPESVNSIEDGAFQNCASLEKFGFVSGNKNYRTNADGTLLLSADGTKLISTSASLTDLDFTQGELESVTAIAEGAFSNAKGLKNITTSDTIKSFPDGLFNYMHLDSLTLSSLPAVDEGTSIFNYTYVKNLTIGFDIEADTFNNFENLMFRKDEYNSRTGITEIENLVFNGYAYIPDSTGEYGNPSIFCSSSYYLKSVTFKNGAYVGKHQFNRFNKLETVKFISNEESVIGESAFGQGEYPSNSITTLELSGVTQIMGNAFIYNKSLTAITLPASLVELDTTAFSGCTGITSFTVEEGNTAYKSSSDGDFIYTADGTFVLSVPGLTELNFEGTGIKTIPDMAFWGSSDQITKLNLTGVEHIGKQAFYNCPNLTDVTWGNTLKSIGADSFYSIGITEINLPGSVIAIGADAFQEYISSGESSKYTSFTIGEISASASAELQPDRWYMIKGNEKTETWESLIKQKPNTMPQSNENTNVLEIIPLPEEGSDTTVIGTIQADVCSQYLQSSNSSTGNGYYYYRFISE